MKNKTLSKILRQTLIETYYQLFETEQKINVFKWYELEDYYYDEVDNCEAYFWAYATGKFELFREGQNIESMISSICNLTNLHRELGQTLLLFSHEKNEYLNDDFLILKQIHLYLEKIQRFQNNLYELKVKELSNIDSELSLLLWKMRGAGDSSVENVAPESYKEKVLKRLFAMAYSNDIWNEKSNYSDLFEKLSSQYIGREMYLNKLFALRTDVANLLGINNKELEKASGGFYQCMDCETIQHECKDILTNQVIDGPLTRELQCWQCDNNESLQFNLRAPQTSLMLGKWQKFEQIWPSIY